MNVHSDFLQSPFERSEDESTFSSWEWQVGTLTRHPNANGRRSFWNDNSSTLTVSRRWNYDVQKSNLANSYRPPISCPWLFSTSLGIIWSDSLHVYLPFRFKTRSFWSLQSPPVSLSINLVQTSFFTIFITFHIVPRHHQSLHFHSQTSFKFSTESSDLWIPTFESKVQTFPPLSSLLPA